MTKDKTVTLPWELAERLDSPHSSVRNAAIESLRRILAKPDAVIPASVAAPVVERQEPLGYVHQWEIDRMAKGQAHWATLWNSDGANNPSRSGSPAVALYTSPPAPAAVAVAMPEDVIRNAERYRFLRDDTANSVRDFCIVKKFWGGTFPDQILVLGDADSEIDACLDKVKEMNR